MIKIDNKTIIEVCTVSSSMTEASKTLGVGYVWLTRKAKALKCWKPNKGGKGTNKFPNGNISRKVFNIDDWNEDKLIKISRCSLRKWIIKLKLIPYKCENGCDNIWKNKLLILDLDHINGNGKDNRKSNLRFLCPNCHSQTENFRNKNR
jgi:hypothetical protein